MLSSSISNSKGWKTNRKIVVIESDDWGSIRMPSKEVFEKCLKAGYPVNLNPYEKNDSLTSKIDLEMLFELLTTYKDINGNHPVITANCVVANPNFEKIAEDKFQKYHYELIHDTFQKYPLHANNLEIWKKANEEKIFHPQFHAREHVNVSKLMNALINKNPEVHFGFNNSMPGNLIKDDVKSGNLYVEATYYKNDQDKKDKLNIYLEGLDLFEKTFGYKSESIIPPNYTWNRSFDKNVVEKGVRFLQGQRKMREPALTKDTYYHRFQGQKNETGLINLVRNVSFEPSIVAIDNQVGACINAISIAFRMNKPAIISSHRINYVGFINPNNRDKSLKLLNNIIKTALQKWPDIEFMTSDELGITINKDYRKKRIIKFLVNNRIKRISKVYNNKMRNFEGANLMVNIDLIKLHKEKYRAISNKSIKIHWLNIYVNSSKIESSNFVPESIYYTLIEPVLNNIHLNLAYADKNIYDLIYEQNIFPLTILRNINGNFYGSTYEPVTIKTNVDLKKYINKFPALIVKPSLESGGGQNIHLFKQSNNVLVDDKENTLNIQFLEDTFKRNYVIQKLILQHVGLSKFNPTSVNTIRVLTYLSSETGKIEILHCILRVGARGAYIDNSRSGGYAVGIDGNGILNKFATNKLGTHFTDVNGLDLTKQHVIPHFQEIKSKALEISSKYLHFRLLGLDMTVDNNGMTKCIEVNTSGNEISFYQLNNGPLFGEFHDEIISYCVKNKSRIYESYTI
ncbi:sugar-transfer associated ATP-grasp domain-containing protein [Flavobacterium sp. ACAM 123]|uniref:sugar-transfer associated ATP-grasp domain-containing protein n=1 Tax=Flavobacterium sp. ACAM 123 TaxID=1189620 RepID=UPI0002F3A5C3|nr:sugar-transfer associated ATP-grasp domain-containing protein [Flavobacterium sp. ACAM 123]